MAIEFRGQIGHGRPRALHGDAGQFARQAACRFRARRRRRRAARHRSTNSAAIGFLAGQREEQVAGLDRARIVGEPRDLRRGGSVQQRPRAPPGAGVPVSSSGAACRAPPGSWFARPGSSGSRPVRRHPRAGCRDSAQRVRRSARTPGAAVMPPVRSLVSGRRIVQHHDDADFRPLGRQQAHEGGDVLVLHVMPVHDFLGGAGLAGDVVALDRRAGAGAARTRDLRQHAGASGRPSAR